MSKDSSLLDRLTYAIGLGEVLSIAFGIITIISVIISIVLYKKSKKRKFLYYEADTDILLAQSPQNVEGIEISYKGRSISRLFSTKLSLYNAGTESIRSSDVPDGDPVRIVWSEGIGFLNLSRVFESNSVNGIRVQDKRENHCDISFDFIDPGEGAIFEILHQNKEDGMFVSGTIIGGNILDKLPSEESWFTIGMWCFVLYVVSFFYLFIYWIVRVFTPISGVWVDIMYGAAFSAILFVSLGILFMNISKRSRGRPTEITRFLMSRRRLEGRDWEYSSLRLSQRIHELEK